MADDNPQERALRPLFGCERVCKFVDECEHPDECITLHPITPIKPRHDGDKQP